MLRLFGHELDAVKTTLDRQQVQPRLAKNMPETAGRVRVALELRRRLSTFRAQFDEMEYRLIDTAEGQRATLKYEEMLVLLDEYEAATYQEWAADVDAKSNVNLDRPLLNRLSGGTIAVNFDPQLASVLREVRYLSELNGGDSSKIPVRAKSMFEQNEQFRAYLGNLDITVTEYNRIQETLLDVRSLWCKESWMPSMSCWSGG